jgi:hypothetical protein
MRLSLAFLLKMHLHYHVVIAKMQLPSTVVVLALVPWMLQQHIGSYPRNLGKWRLCCVFTDDSAAKTANVNRP